MEIQASLLGYLNGGSDDIAINKLFRKLLPQLQYFSFRCFNSCTWYQPMLLLYRLKAPKPFRSSGHLCYSTKVCDPLRILFCGSEEYSIASLRALRDEQARQPESILSIDVVCRPPKRVSRGLRTIRDGMESFILKVQLAHDSKFQSNLLPRRWVCLSMRLTHLRDGQYASMLRLFSCPDISAASSAVRWTDQFGRRGLIRPLRTATHTERRQIWRLESSPVPSSRVRALLSPLHAREVYSDNVSFRGPAPLHHMLLAGETKTGVTMQTLHPLRFDHGIVLDQTPSPGFDIPDPGRCTVDQLRTIVAASSARMLVDGIRNKIFVPPLEEVGWHGREDDTTSLRHAPKITPEDKHIKWRRWTSVELSRRNRILGPLWNLTVSEEGPRRLLFPTVQLHCARRVEELDSNPGFPVGRLYYRSRRGSSETGPVLVNTVDQTTVEIPQIKIEGEQAKPAIDLFRSGNRKRFPLTTISDQNGTWHTLQVALT